MIAVDGKTICGSGNESHKAYHVVSAFVAENQITGEITTGEKSNEITAVPELLDSLNISGSIVIADAMSCQKKIVKKVQEKRTSLPCVGDGEQCSFKVYSAEREMRGNA